MFRHSIFIIILLLVIGFTVVNLQKAELNGKWVYTDNTIFSGYINLGGLYFLILNKIKNLSTLETSMLNSALAQIGNKEGPTVDAIVKWILDWDYKGLFRPTGGLWWAVDADGTMRLFLKGEVKPGSFSEYLSTLNVNPVKPTILEENRVVLPPPGGKGMSIEIAPEGIMIGRPTPTPGITTEWQPFINIISSPLTFFAMEAILEKAQRIKGPGIIDILPINRGRVHFQMNEFQVLVTLQDSALLPQATEMIKQGLNFGKEYLRNSASSLPPWVPIPIITQALDQIKIVNREQWLGVALENITPEQGQALGSGFAGLVVAVVVPNFMKAREQAKLRACFANMRVALGAIEMYNMDHSEMKHDLIMADIKKGGILMEKGYLKSEITPPKPECEYYSNGDLCENGKIFCRYHGTVEDPNTWSFLRPNTGQQQPNRYQTPLMSPSNSGRSIQSIFGEIGRKLQEAPRAIEPTSQPQQPVQPVEIKPQSEEARPLPVQPTSIPKGYLSGDDVNIRTTPEIRNDNRIALLDKFTRLEILEKTDGVQPWYKIKTSDGKVGWVRSDFVQIVASYEGIPQPSKKTGRNIRRRSK